jgi:hypothetical protein
MRTRGGDDRKEEEEEEEEEKEEEEEEEAFRSLDKGKTFLCSGDPATRRRERRLEIKLVRLVTGKVDDMFERV